MVTALREQSFTAVKLGWGPLGSMLAHVLEAPEYVDRWLTPPSLIDAAHIGNLAEEAGGIDDLSTDVDGRLLAQDVHGTGHVIADGHARGDETRDEFVALRGVVRWRRDG